jgi:hypothetical protein
MRKIAPTAATIIGSAVLAASPLSITWLEPQKSVTVSQDVANAAIGKPLSAGSVAGVHRRHERRENRHATPVK